MFIQEGSPKNPSPPLQSIWKEILQTYMQTTQNNPPNIVEWAQGAWYKGLHFQKTIFFFCSLHPSILKIIIPSLWTLWIPDELGLCHMYVLWWILKWHQLKYWHATFGMGIEKQFGKKTSQVHSPLILNAVLTPLAVSNTLTSFYLLSFPL